MVRSLEEIIERIDRGRAVVLTAQEVRERVEREGDIEDTDVDVVTCATRAVMSGTYASLSFRVADPHEFVRAKKVFMNGVPAHVGPCPNERLGVVDLMVFGTAHSDDPNYGGGHLFRELVEGRDIMVRVETSSGWTSSTTVCLEDIPHARMFATRHTFKNYSAFVNPTSRPVSSIFHAVGFNPDLGGATFSGCGQLNPLENDPELDSIGVGTRVLMNGAEGYVIGTGTRSKPGKPNLAGYADMHDMNPEYLGGFNTPEGPECIASWAIPIPITNQRILESITRLDRDLKLPIINVDTRTDYGEANYGDVWTDVDLEVEYSPDACKGCSECVVQESCPLDAVSIDNGLATLDRSRCFNCGLCTTLCEAFYAELGSIQCDDTTVPVVLRQSDRARALQLAEDLRDRILQGSFKLSGMIDRIQ